MLEVKEHHFDKVIVGDHTFPRPLNFYGQAFYDNQENEYAAIFRQNEKTVKDFDESYLGQSSEYSGSY